MFIRYSSKILGRQTDNRAEEKIGLEIKNQGSSANRSVFIAIRLCKVRAGERSGACGREGGPAVSWGRVKNFQGANLSEAHVLIK